MWLIVDLNRERTCLNLSWYSSPDSQVSIDARMSGGIKWNNDAFVGLIVFVGNCVIDDQWCLEGRNSGL